MSALVQPIVVASTGSHEDVVLAAAHASVLAHDDHPSWDEWLLQRFTKSVRQANPTKFKRLYNEYGATAHLVGEAAAFALRPSRYEDFPKPVRKLRVCGVQMPHTTPVASAVPEGPCVVVNADLGMSTGKEAAQVAHAFWVSGTPVSVVRVGNDEFHRQREHARWVCRDSGLTEFHQPTETVLLL